MNLADLEFKAEDFGWIDDGSGRPAQAYADYCNRLLRERLARAEEVFAESPMLDIWTARGDDDTHSARLVCIERIAPEAKP